MSLSTFDLFKIGIGPSSSHTMGPMRAAREFALRLESAGLLEKTGEVVTRLYGSLALTGSGHGTDRAVLLGLTGEDPRTVDPDAMESTLREIRSSGQLKLLGHHPIPFDEPMQLLFMRAQRRPRHTNGMRFTALDTTGTRLAEEEYYSLGGGFIVRGEEPEDQGASAAPPYPFASGEELLALGREHGLEIFELMLANERTWRTPEQIRAQLLAIWQVMQECVARGFRQNGVLPGVLKVRRRAPKMHRTLTE